MLYSTLNKMYALMSNEILNIHFKNLNHSWYFMCFLHTDSLDEHDLQGILAEIKSVSQVQSLGLALGLLVSAIDKIQKDFSTVKEQKIQVIKFWLKRTEIIRNMQSRNPTWSQLADAVADEDAALSDSIRCKYCKT